MNIPQFVYLSPVDGHLGCFQFLVLQIKLPRTFVFRSFVDICFISLQYLSRYGFPR